MVRVTMAAAAMAGMAVPGHDRRRCPFGIAGHGGGGSDRRFPGSADVVAGQEQTLALVTNDGAIEATDTAFV